MAKKVIRAKARKTAKQRSAAKKKGAAKKAGRKGGAKTTNSF